MLHNFYQGRKVLVTGHTGFKGSWFSLWLHELGAQVIGYALDPPTEPSLFHICGLERKVHSLKGDIRNLPRLREACDQHQPEIIFHMAAQSLVRLSYEEPVATYETNVIGTVNILEACRHTPSVRAIIIVTSDKCYENREWIWGYRENDPMGGHDPYSSSKGCAELVTDAYRQSFFNPEKQKGFCPSVASVRAGNVIGGGDWAKDRLIPDCIKALLEKKPIVVRNPEAIRPWQFVLEPLYGYLLLGRSLFLEGSQFAGGWNFGPCSQDVQPVKWLVERVVNIWADESSWVIDRRNDHLHESHCLRLDWSKAHAKLHWHPLWNLETALEKTVTWYRAYKHGQDMVEITGEQIHSYEKSIK